MSDSSDQPTRVAMIVANDVSVDTRVRKEAAAIASTGMDVTIIGINLDRPRQELSMGDVRVIRVPVSPYLANDERDRLRRAARRGGGDGSWLPRAFHQITSSDYQLSPHERHIEGLRQQLAVRERNARIGWLREELDQLRSANPIKRAAMGRVRIRQINHLKRQGQAAQHRRGRDGRSTDEIDARLANFAPPAEPRSFRRLRWTPVDWRTVLASYEDYELAMGPELDTLAPDVIHAHDIHCVAVAVRAAGRIRARTGVRPRLVYDAHEYIAGIPRYTPQVLGAMVHLEAEYIDNFDEVITVSQPLADLLVDNYALTKPPRLVLNIPSRHDPSPDDPSLRAATGVGPDIPLIVYSGGVSLMRGAHTLVRALTHLPDVHLAIVAKRVTNYVETLLAIADRDGTRDRLHIVGFVEPHLVTGYLSTATLGVHPMVSGWANHEIALPNKLFEYMHAGLPIVVSDCRAMAEFVRDNDLGGVFHSEDPDDLARTIQEVLDNLDRHRAAVANEELRTTYSWAAQQRTLVELYSGLTGQVLSSEGQVITSIDETDAKASAVVAHRPTRLLIGPSNMAGQATEWARAYHRIHPDTPVDTLARARDRLNFPTTQTATPKQWRNLDWQLQHARHVLTAYTHVLSEAGRSVLGRLNGGFFDDDLPALANAGIMCAVVLHGSEIRSPKTHLALEPFSPFSEPHGDLTARLQEGSALIRARLDRAGVPVFVSTLGLLDHVKQASWLPLTIDVDLWQTAKPALSTGPVRVGHLPSNSVLKGSNVVDKIASQLHADGVIVYVRRNDLAPTEVPDFMRSVDVYIDGMVLGDYGVTACQAMSMNRLTLGNVGARVQDRLPRELPMLHVTPDTLHDTLSDIARDPDEYRKHARAGRAFVLDLHDGQRAAAVLDEWINQSS